MTFCFLTFRQFFALGLLFIVICDSTAAFHPSVIPQRARGGRVYREALQNLERHERQRSYTSRLPVNYYRQLVDHDDLAAGTFKQRWWVDRSHWDSEVGPAILYVNGEGPASPSPGGFVVDYASSVKAIVFSLEHRFYGESLPAPLTNRTMLKYLTVENALADLRSFKLYAEQSVLRKKVKWLIVGGSYSGALSAWARTIYPDDFYAAWSSSGVVNAIFDFYDFDGHLLSVLPPSCSNAIRALFETFSEAYDDPNRREPMMRAFGSPSYFTKADMAWMLADGSAMAVQYGHKDSLCSFIESVNKSDVFTQYGNFMKALWGENFTSKCYYSTECLSDVKYSEQWGSDYTWAYQCCSQLAYWQTSYPGSLRLGDITTSYFINQCRSAFGGQTFPDTFAFNNIYGGSRPAATRVVATQGSDDPWLPAGVTQALNEEYPEIVAQCNGCGHCRDMASPKDGDPPSLTAQRQALRAYLNRWMRD